MPLYLMMVQSEGVVRLEGRGAVRVHGAGRGRGVLQAGCMVQSECETIYCVSVYV